MSCVSWSPDGKTVATGSSDGTILIWTADQFIQSLKRTDKLSGGECEKLWQALADPEAAPAYRALARLAAHPAETMELLHKSLPPVRTPDSKRVALLLADLGNEQFAIRNKAATELEEMGELVSAALKEAAAKNPSLEVVRRLEVLHEKSLLAHLAPAKLRTCRAVVLLTRIGTPESRQLLRALAGGAVQARLTQEAKAALAR